MKMNIVSKVYNEASFTDPLQLKFGWGKGWERQLGKSNYFNNFNNYSVLTWWTFSFIVYTLYNGLYNN